MKTGSRKVSSFNSPSLALSDQSTTLPCVGWNEAWKMATDDTLVQGKHVGRLPTEILGVILTSWRRHSTSVVGGGLASWHSDVYVTYVVTASGLPWSAMSQQPQTISINDLDISQLADIKKQLEEVSFSFINLLRQPPTDLVAGTQSPHIFIRATKASAG